MLDELSRIKIEKIIQKDHPKINQKERPSIPEQRIKKKKFEKPRRKRQKVKSK